MKEYHNENEISINNFQTLKEKPWAEKKAVTMKIARSFNRIGYERRVEQLTNCGTFLEFAQYSNNTIKLHNANFCRARMCPMCAWRRSLKVGYQVSQVLDYALKDKHNKLLFLTLTVKNVESEKLSETISELFKGYDKLLMQSRVKKAVKGAFRALEVTYNARTNSYHPHLHCILLVDHTYGGYNDKSYIGQREWSELWKNCMGIAYIPIVDIRKVRPNRRSYDNTTGIAAEVSKGETLVQENLSLSDYVSKGVIDDDICLPNSVLDEVIKTLDNSLAHRRLFSFRGDLSKAYRELGLDDMEDGDLINVKGDEMNEQLEYVLVKYRWMLGGYVMLNDENEAVRIDELMGPRDSAGPVDTDIDNIPDDVPELDLYADEVAEAIYFFVGQDEVYNDFCEHSIYTDLSMAEYVEKFCFTDFREWARQTYGFDVVLFEHCIP